MTDEQWTRAYWMVWKAYVQNRAHDGYPFTAIQIDSRHKLYRLEGGTLIRVDKKPMKR